jgi:hypothetical protein
LEDEDMADGAMTKESRKDPPKPQSRFVQLNRLRDALYDYDMRYAEGLKYEAPIRHAEEYRVFGWDLRKQNWKLVGRFSDGELGVAEAAAREWHEKVLALTGSYDEANPPSNETLQDGLWKTAPKTQRWTRKKPEAGWEAGVVGHFGPLEKPYKIDTSRMVK